MIQDIDTNIVYISDKLKNRKGTKDFYDNLLDLFRELNIHHEIIKDCTDFWVRDFMPIQINDEDFLKYEYSPDYLHINEQYEKYITDPTEACKKIGIKYRTTDIVIDGGNVVLCGDKVVMTQKVFTANNKKVYDADFLNELEKVFGHKVIIIPWEPSAELTENYEKNGDDVYGHSDGLIKYCGDNRILMSNYRDDKEEIAIEIRQRLV